VANWRDREVWEIYWSGVKKLGEGNQAKISACLWGGKNRKQNVLKKETNSVLILGGKSARSNRREKDWEGTRRGKLMTNPKKGERRVNKKRRSKESHKIATRRQVRG